MMAEQVANRRQLPVIVVFGGSGQLGRALAELAPAFADAADMVVVDRATTDIANAADVTAAFEKHKPSLVINAAAYTAVDAAEAHEALAFAGNALGPHHLATSCAAAGIPLIHLSTDYVFDGSCNAPLPPSTPTSPRNAYGRSKLAGEWAIQAAHEHYYIFRTSWVFGPWGNNFVRSMLRLGASRPELSIVNDQHGSPTYVMDLAEALLQVAAKLLNGEPCAPGIYHLSNAGRTTWFDFAEAIFAIAASHGNERPQLRPIPSSDYPTPASRPQWSVLDCSTTRDTFGLLLPPWHDGLERCMSRLMSSNP